VCTDLDQARRLVGQSNFQRFEILNSEVVLVEMTKKIILLNKAIYTGFACLELSKLVMVDHVFDIIEKRSSKRILRMLLDSMDDFNVHVYMLTGSFSSFPNNLLVFQCINCFEF